MATPIPQNRAAFTEEEVRAATLGTLAGRSHAVPFRGVATDTRENLTGKIFVALRGEQFDGHDYVERAVAAGAKALVVSRPIVATPDDVTVVQVADTLKALGDLAAYHRRRWGGRVVAVAGSAGKTTTRSVISKLLGEAHGTRVHSTIGNLNNRIGVPMILFGLTSEHDFAVVELGTNQPGEVAHLAQMAAPDVAVLTLIDLEHTEGLGSLDGVEEEEGAVFRYLGVSGTAVGYGEDERVLRRLRASGAPVVSYGFEAARDVQIVDQRFVSDQLCELTLRRTTGVLDFTSPLIGRPGALAAAAGVSAVEALLGRPLTSEQCARALEKAGEPGRNQVLVLPGRRLVVDDTYNSNPASVENSVATGALLARRSGGRLWLVLGEMLELGGLSPDSHAKMGELAVRSGAHGVFFVQGDAKISWETAHARLGYSHFVEDAAEVAHLLAPLVAENDVVVVKASRGVRAERVVRGLEAFYKPVPTGAPRTEGEGGGFTS